ncbi:MAG TPA: methionine--tRNA ligase [Acidobacteriaceae bacterium]|nr:methionine--tRNA ligase [Acidobacteriaceae bacterium]
MVNWPFAMPDQPNKFYLTTPIYYVNARPHIGHAYTTIAADVLARRHRLLGEDVFFLTGTDEHGQKIERSAAAAGIPPQQFADEVSASFAALWQRMGITHNKFIRTTSAEHKRGVQKLFRKLQETGAIYLDSYTGAYCVSDETFVDLPAGTPCPDCGRPLEIVTEENYFFRLAQYQQQLIDLIESGTLAVEPEARRNEVLSFVRGGLKDLSISRTSFQWGIPVPDNEKHVIYVWLDALANYITAVGYGSDAPEDIASFEKYWPADLHLVGKEIIRFHCVYWPAFLLAAGIPLPKKIQAHGWLLFEESKMSKSRGNIVRTETILDAFGDHYRASLAAHNAKLAANFEKLAKDQEHPAEAANAEQIKNAVILSEAAGDKRAAQSKDLHVDETDTAAQPSQTRQPAASVLLKGTASAVPSDAAEPGGALAPEVTPLAEPTKEDCDLFAADVLRYFLLREIPFGQDGSFSFDALITRYNADLANGYGNLVSRTLSMINSYCSSEIPVPPSQDSALETLLSEWTPRERDEEEQAAEEARLKAHLEELEEIESKEGYYLRHELRGIAVEVAQSDKYLTSEQPWKLAKNGDDRGLEKMRLVLYEVAQSIQLMTARLHPVMPHTTAKVWAQLGLGDIEAAARNGELKNLQWGGLKPGTKLGPLAPIFPRAPKELAQVMSDIESQNNPPKPAAESAVPGPSAAAPTPSQKSVSSVESVLSSSPEAAQTSPLISIDDFAKVDLRVARVLVAERIPKADKLLRLEVDLGYEKRQILAGIAQFYEPEQLVGRKVVIVANLAPRKMRGLESQGMVVAASVGDGPPALASFLEDIEIGARLR